MDQAFTSGWSRVAYGLRAIVRQLAAAVYVVIATGLMMRWLGWHAGVSLLVEPSVTLLGGFILGAAISGPWWATHLIGFCVSLLDLSLLLLFPGALQGHAVLTLVLGSAVTTFLGALGARLAVWRVRRKDADGKGA